MDISVKFGDLRFNYRVCAVIINDNKLLCMKDKRSEYFYLPGGRVKIGESAQDAVLRELKEELNLQNAKISRPLFLNQSFFTEDVSKEQYHELCVYFLIDVSSTDLTLRGETFDGKEAEKGQVFYWLTFDEVKNSYLYPLFIKENIDNLPSTFEIRTEIQ